MDTGSTITGPPIVQEVSTLSALAPRFFLAATSVNELITIMERRAHRTPELIYKFDNLFGSVFFAEVEKEELK